MEKNDAFTVFFRRCIRDSGSVTGQLLADAFEDGVTSALESGPIIIFRPDSLTMDIWVTAVNYHKPTRRRSLRRQ